MLKLIDGMLLYHGSYCEVSSPDLEKCAAFKDFGKGFYLTSSKEQAESFIRTSLKKAKAQGVIDEAQNYGVISTFRYSKKDNILDYTFANADADAEWLHCVVRHRKEDTFPEKVDELKQYDIIGGKIADDATNVTIITYLVGAYGTIGTEDADALCIGRLIPERLKDQYCFRTENALKTLTFVESEQVWKN